MDDGRWTDESVTGRPKHGPGPNRRCGCLENIDHRRPLACLGPADLSSQLVTRVTDTEQRRGASSRKARRGIRAKHARRRAMVRLRHGAADGGAWVRAFGNKHERNIGFFWVRLPWWTASAATSNTAEQGRGGKKRPRTYPTRQLKRRSRLSTTSVPHPPPS
jgi:hypothetical protein